MSKKSCSSSMIRDPCKTGIVRAVARRDDANCLEVNMVW